VSRRFLNVLREEMGRLCGLTGMLVRIWVMWTGHLTKMDAGYY